MPRGRDRTEAFLAFGKMCFCCLTRSSTAFARTQHVGSGLHAKAKAKARRARTRRKDLNGRISRESLARGNPPMKRGKILVKFWMTASPKHRLKSVAWEVLCEVFPEDVLCQAPLSLAPQVGKEGGRFAGATACRRRGALQRPVSAALCMTWLRSSETFW